MQEVTVMAPSWTCGITSTHSSHPWQQNQPTRKIIRKAINTRLGKMKAEGFSGALLPMLETCLQFLIREDPTGVAATKPKHHNYWDCALAPRRPQVPSPNDQGPMLHNKRSHCNEKPAPHKSRMSPASTTTTKKLWQESPALPKINNKAF